jgi:HK97 family phage portal protein
MGLVARLLEKRLMTYQQVFLSGLDWRTGATAAGVNVNEATALGWIPFLASVLIISDNVASLPLHVLANRPGGGVEQEPGHPLDTVLHDQANPRMTAFGFRQLLMSHVLAWGNGYAVVDWRGDGRVGALYPRRPDWTEPFLTPSGAKAFKYQPPTGPPETYTAGQMFHLMGLSPDGLKGYSMLTLAREAIARGIAVEQFGGRFFANDARPGVVLTHPKTLSDTAKGNLEKSWLEKHQGLANASRPAILEEGMSITEIGIPPEDAQFLQTAQFTARQMAQLFRIPPHMLGDVTGSTSWGTGIEQQSIGFVQHTLMPWLVMWEQTIRRDLLAPSDQMRLFAKHNVSGLQRGDFKSRMEGYNVARNGGWMSADDIRALEDMNPMPDGQGQLYYMPLNMAPIGSQPTLDLSPPPPDEEQEPTP